MQNLGLWKKENRIVFNQIRLILVLTHPLTAGKAILTWERQLLWTRPNLWNPRIANPSCRAHRIKNWCHCLRRKRCTWTTAKSTTRMKLLACKNKRQIPKIYRFLETAIKCFSWLNHPTKRRQGKTPWALDRRTRIKVQPMTRNRLIGRNSHPKWTQIWIQGTMQKFHLDHSIRCQRSTSLLRCSSNASMRSLVILALF